MTFGGAIEALFEGYGVYREGWGGGYLELIDVTNDDQLTTPYIVLVTESDVLPWAITQTDVLIDDWHIIELQEEEESE